MAACWRDYQLSCVQKAFDAEIEQIEREYESEKVNLKERLLNSLLEQRKRLMEGKDLEESQGMEHGTCFVYYFESSIKVEVSSTATSGGKVQRKLRGKRIDGPGGESGKASGGTKKRQLFGLDDTL